jgi:hypothetical protein
MTKPQLTGHLPKTPDWKKPVSLTTLPRRTKAIGPPTSRLRKNNYKLLTKSFNLGQARSLVA